MTDQIKSEWWGESSTQEEGTGFLKKILAYFNIQPGLKTTERNMTAFSLQLVLGILPMVLGLS